MANGNGDPVGFLMSMIFRMLVLTVAVTLIISACVTAIGGVVSNFSERKKRREALRKTTGAVPAEGFLADVRMADVPERSQKQFHYKLSVHYRDTSNTVRRALIGVVSKYPIAFQEGQSIPLRIFRQPLLQPLPDAYDPSRGADGRLPSVIAFRSWLGRPVDETGTVMREEDFVSVTMDLQQKIERSRKALLIWIIAGVIGNLLTIRMALLMIGADPYA